MAYIAIKPCNLAGISFLIGDSIPAEAIQPDAVKRLIKMGIIAEASGPEATQPKVKTETITVESLDITIKAEGGDLALNVSKEGIREIFSILTGNMKNAEATIKKMEEDDALILLHLADQRKSVKDLAETRAKKLAEKTKAGEE